MEQYQAETIGEMISGDVQDGAMESGGQPLTSVPSGRDEAPAVGRPRRDRRPSGKYTPDEYDLSAVSTTHTKKVVLSGIILKKKRMQQKKKNQ